MEVACALVAPDASVRVARFAHRVLGGGSAAQSWEREPAVDALGALRGAVAAATGLPPCAPLVLHARAVGGDFVRLGDAGDLLSCVQALARGPSRLLELQVYTDEATAAAAASTATALAPAAPPPPAAGAAAPAAAVTAEHDVVMMAPCSFDAIAVAGSGANARVYYVEGRAGACGAWWPGASGGGAGVRRVLSRDLNIPTAVRVVDDAVYVLETGGVAPGDGRVSCFDARWPAGRTVADGLCLPRGLHVTRAHVVYFSAAPPGTAGASAGDECIVYRVDARAGGRGGAPPPHVEPVFRRGGGRGGGVHDLVVLPDGEIVLACAPPEGVDGGGARPRARTAAAGFRATRRCRRHARAVRAGGWHGRGAGGPRARVRA